MIVCKNCGERQQSGTVFCGRCGAFLEWEGEAVSESVAEPVESDIERLPAPAETAAVPTRQPSVAAKRPDGPAPQPISELPTGSLICGSCGTGNDPARHFCRSCGASLADARAATRPPWWRRLFRSEKSYVAGTRRKRSRRLRRAGGAITAVLIIVAAVVVAIPLRPTIVRAYHNIRNDVAKPQAVHPDRVSASGVITHHPAALAFDGAKNTYWAAPPTRRPGDQPTLHARFAKKIHLTDIGITPGVSTSTPQFLAAPRPRALEITAHIGRTSATRRFPLTDSAGFQKFHWDIDNVTLLDLRVTGSNKSTPRIDTAITEIEFYARR